MRVGRAFAAVIAVAAATACSQTVGGTAERARPRDRNLDATDYDCGRMHGEDIQHLLGAGDVVQPFSGAVCQYVLTAEAGPIDVVFSWFDTGSVDRERSVAVERGARITDGDVERHSAFTAQRPDNPKACAATAGAGPGVLTWWVQFRSGGGDPCQSAQKLLAATLAGDL